MEADLKVLRHQVAGRQVRINCIENEDDVPAFKSWVQRHKEFDFDTESTDLNPFSADHTLRLAQFGVGAESWVLPVEKGPRYAWLAKTVLEYADGLTMHNATHDLLEVDQHLGISIESLYPKTTDTSILSRLVDSRASHEGGTGHSLEDLTRAYIDAEVAEEVKGSVRQMAKELKTTKSKFYRVVPIDHEGYLLYAGMDPVLTGLSRRALSPRVPSSARQLIQYEHELALYCALMERRGFLLDLEYTNKQAEALDEERASYEAKALELGLENVNSAKQVGEAFMRDGWKPDTFTDNGQPQVNKTTLDKLVAEGYELAVCVQKAKQATKWNAAYYRTFLQEVDEAGRIHPGIHTMQARTARMSITRPALQTLPSQDKQVRNAFLSEEGEVIVSIDFANQELRVAAAISNDSRMRRAFLNGEDLHQVTADGAGVARKTGKMANFLVCFGGGWKALMTQGGVSEEIAKKTIDGFNKTYPAVPKLSKKLGKEAKIKGYIETFTGRRLYVDKARTYSAINYAIQSGARDITAQGIIKCFREGLGDYIRLPIHDEVVSSVPIGEVEEVSKAISGCLNSSLMGVEIPTDIEIGERTWGSAK